VSNIRYRLATPADALAIAALHTDSWRRSYRGILPDPFLDHEVDANRAALWQQRFAEPDPAHTTLTIIAERDGEFAAFAHTIDGVDAEFGPLLDNLHVRFDIKRSGIGKRLMAETAAWLERHTAASGLHLWVFEANVAARQFYDALGGQVAGTGVSPEGGGGAPALRYWWPHLDTLSALLPQGGAALR
jgi:GNAT superfamily N-acetyltransferase